MWIRRRARILYSTIEWPLFTFRRGSHSCWTKIRISSAYSSHNLKLAHCFFEGNVEFFSSLGSNVGKKTRHEVLTKSLKEGVRSAPKEIGSQSNPLGSRRWEVLSSISACRTHRLRRIMFVFGSFAASFILLSSFLCVHYFAPGRSLALKWGAIHFRTE